jgi:isopenicillin N synthase-like dioxygenase
MSNIPVVNLAAFLEGSIKDQKLIAAEVDEICKNVGFLIIEQHGIEKHVIDDAWSATRAFFDLSMEEKLASQSIAADCPRGYFPFAAEALAQSLGVETPPDIKESFGIGPVGSPPRAISAEQMDFHFGKNIWPARPANLRNALTTYYDDMEALGLRILQLFAAALGLPHDYFAAGHTAPRCALRCLNYPAVDKPPLANQRAAGEHSDYGSFTMLKSDPKISGLEIKLASGTWTAAPLVQDAFIVNIGDMLARWTNDRWVSTLHRVTSPQIQDGGTHRRQSMAFFHNANFDAKIECIPTCRDADGNQKYGAVEAGDYLMQRFKSALANS